MLVLLTSRSEDCGQVQAVAGEELRDTTRLRGFVFAVHLSQEILQGRAEDRNPEKADNTQCIEGMPHIYE